MVSYRSVNVSSFHSHQNVAFVHFCKCAFWLRRPLTQKEQVALKEDPNSKDKEPHVTAETFPTAVRAAAPLLMIP